jgi:hypothetical protein
MTKYLPLNPESWKPVQVITATYPNGGGIQTDGEYGSIRCYNAIDSLTHLLDLHDRNFVVYTMLEGAKLADSTHGKFWTAFYWNDRVSYYTCVKKLRVYPLPTDTYSLNDAWPFFEWLRELGVAPGSFTSLSQKVWRRSLARPVTFFDEGKHGRLALYGNRKEARTGLYSNVRYQDLSSAFPSAMASSLFPRTIRETSNKNSIPPYGYCLATVRIPQGLDWGPIPCRLGEKAVTYGWGEQTDWWMSEDLQHVLRVGGSVGIHRAYRGFDLRPVFAEWWQGIMLPARDSLSDDARLLVKRLGNRLWSSFAVGGSCKVAEWVDGSNRRIVDRRTALRGMRYETYIAAQITALVRTRVFDALYSISDPVYVDTDGIICREMEDFGDGWRIKRRMRRVAVHSPQNYEWECYRCGIFQCGGPHYSVSVPTKSRREQQIILKSPQMPFNPLYGITVSPVESLSVLRERYRYEQPTADQHVKEWLRKVDPEGTQTHLSF